MKNQNGIQWFQTINNSSAMMRVFGGFSVLDNIDIVDHAAIYDFAIIVENYLNMTEILKNEKEKISVS